MNVTPARESVHGRGQGSRGSLLPQILPPVLAFVAAVALWQLGVVLFKPPSYFLPGPLGVLAAFWERGPQLLQATWLTFRASALALLLSTVLGAALALALASSTGLYRALFPYTVVLQTTPVIAVAPVVIIWFGVGLPAIVTIAVLVSIFPVVASTTAGLLSTDKELERLFDLYRASPWQGLVKLRLPYALPYFFAGVRVAAGLAVIGAIVGEFVAGMGGNRGGLGFFITDAAGRLKMADVFAAAFVSAGLGVGFLLLIDFVSRSSLRHWHASVSEED